MARVCEIFKKGDVSDCENYRPISLLCIGYKVFAALIMNRLRAAGCDEHIWPTQFAFKRGRGTADALLAARRMIELSVAAQNSPALLLALDWAKAFDCICPEALIDALARFGLPQQLANMIQKVYSERRFFVFECGARSTTRRQSSGISQGCPLSPYLFSILMTVLVHDARSKLLEESGIDLPTDTLSELLYADDTVLFGSKGHVVQKYMESIIACGAEYGLELNWKKVEMMRIGSHENIFKPDGQLVMSKESIIYLGALLHQDGRMEAELARRLGIASAEFRMLQRVWRHTRLTAEDKYRIYLSCVVSRLLYGLQAAWLIKVARARLDGFHAKCLRQILGITPSYWSRISNEAVLQALQAPKLTDILLQQQLNFFGHIARRAATCPIRQLVFADGGLTIKDEALKRKRGRPRQTWATEIYRVALEMTGSVQCLEEAILNKSAWKAATRSRRSG